MTRAYSEANKLISIFCSSYSLRSVARQKQTNRKKKGIKLVTFFPRFIYYFSFFSFDFCGPIATNVKIDKNLRSGSVASFHSRSHIFVVRSAVCSLIVLVRVFPPSLAFHFFPRFHFSFESGPFRYNLNLTKRYKWKRYFFPPMELWWTIGNETGLPWKPNRETETAWIEIKMKQKRKKKGRRRRNLINEATPILEQCYSLFSDAKILSCSNENYRKGERTLKTLGKWKIKVECR